MALGVVVSKFKTYISRVDTYFIIHVSIIAIANIKSSVFTRSVVLPVLCALCASTPQA